MITVRNKFDTLQEASERHSPNDEYEDFVSANLTAAAEYIPKVQCLILSESIAVKEKTR